MVVEEILEFSANSHNSTGEVQWSIVLTALLDVWVKTVVRYPTKREAHGEVEDRSRFLTHRGTSQSYP